MPTPKEYVRTAQQLGSVEKHLQSGISSATTQDAFVYSNTTLKQMKEEILSSVVEPQMLSLMMQEENMKKFKNRLDYEIKVKSNDGTVLVEGSTHGKTLERVFQELQTNFEHNKEVSKAKYRFLDTLKASGWDVEKKNDGMIATVQLKATYRKR